MINLITNLITSKKKSITFRITIILATVTTLILLGLGHVIGVTVKNHFLEEDLHLINGKIELISNLLSEIKTTNELKFISPQLNDALVGHQGLVVNLFDSNNKLLYATETNIFPENIIKLTNNNLQSWKINNKIWRGKTTSFTPINQIFPPIIIAIAVNISPHQNFMQFFHQILWGYTAIAALIVGFLVWLIVRYELATLKKIGNAANEITAIRLDYRLDINTFPDELANLAATFNQMLARLEESFRRLKDFSSDLAHELRTPISNLMTETQVTLSKERDLEEYKEVLISNSEEFQHLARMISDMLFLAQAENGLIIPNKESIDLSVQIKELFDFFDAFAAEKEIKLILDGNAQILGDKLMIRRALANLITNALHYSPNGKEIMISITPNSVDKQKNGFAKNNIILKIKNTGVTISAEHLNKIFERFYRIDQSRHKSSEGAGLGLAITRSIILAHGGIIKAESNQSSVCFIITFPYFAL